MWEILFLLLPVAALSGWYIGRKTNLQRSVSREQQRSSNYYAGLNYLLNEQPDKAVDAFLQILDTNNEMIEIHLMLGNLFRRRGEVDRSIRIHQGLLARPSLSKTEQAILLLELGKDYYHAGMYDRAEDIFVRLLDMGEQLEISLDYLLNIYEQAKDWYKAIDTAVKIQVISNKDVRGNIAHYYCELAEQAIKKQNEYKLAIKLLKKAINVNKNSVRASILQGDASKELGKYTRAIKYYKQVDKQDLRYLGQIIVPLADCYVREGDPKGCVEYLKRCLVRMHGSMVSNGEIQDAATIGSFSKSERSECNERIKFHAILQLVDLLIEQEGTNSAVCYITECLQQSPSLQGVHKMLELLLRDEVGKIRSDLRAVSEIVKELLVKEPKYKCEICGFPSNTLQWQCPGCRRWVA